MKRPLTSLLLGLALFALSSPSAHAQLWFFPDFALPSSSDTPFTWVSGTYGRGLNEYSGELNAFGAALGRTGTRVAFQGAIGYASEDDNGELTLGGSASVDLNSGDGVRLAVQAGIGWFGIDSGDEGITALRFPIGLALKQTFRGDSYSLTPWVMPRLNIRRWSGFGETESETDPGASAGLSYSSAGGLGFHVALDAFFPEDITVWQMGVGVHYVLGERE